VAFEYDKQLTFFLFSNRPDVHECLNHKWLTTEDTISMPIISLNVTITTLPFDADPFINFDEDKENSVKSLENGDKETPTITAIVQHHNTKLRLEKSSSISLFPDAPTTPKVSRKMLYDEEVCRKTTCDDNNSSFLIPVPST
jgi:hypothetical protein